MNPFIRAKFYISLCFIALGLIGMIYYTYVYPKQLMNSMFNSANGSVGRNFQQLSTAAYSASYNHVIPVALFLGGIILLASIRPERPE